MPLRRKKWTEEEEDALICKYGELLRSGFLSKAKSRERKFEPIAGHVNALFHTPNPVAYPWLWTWKDASTKVQNMRHQYLGVKAKIRKHSDELETFEWQDGLSQWSNFLKYKEVFGDQELDVNEFFTHPVTVPSSSAATSRPHLLAALRHPPRDQSQSVPHAPIFADSGIHSLSKDLMNNSGLCLEDHNEGLMLKDAAASMMDQAVLDGQSGDLTTGLDFEYDGAAADSLKNTGSLKNADEDYEDDDGSALAYARLKRIRQNAKLKSNFDASAHDSLLLTLFARHFAELNERAARREEKLLEREKEWEKRHTLLETELARQRQDWERERRDMLEMWRQENDKRETDRLERELNFVKVEHERREMERERDRAREEKLERDKMEWREKMEIQSTQHQAAMMQMQLQIAQNQQNALTLLSGATVQVLDHAGDFSLEGSSTNTFVSQLLHNLQTHGTSMVPCSVRRGSNESSDSQLDTD